MPKTLQPRIFLFDSRRSNLVEWLPMLLLLLRTVQWLFVIYTWLIIIRVLGSWFPAFAQHRIMQFIAFYTDPYLNLFRRLIPPIGGVLDLSPWIALLALQFLEQFIFYLLRLCL